MEYLICKAEIEAVAELLEAEAQKPLRCRQPGCTKPAVEEMWPGWMVCREHSRLMSK
jgi:hypothetical protein